MLNNVVGILGATAMGCSKYLESYELLIMGRFLIGVNCGKSTTVQAPTLFTIVAHCRSIFWSAG